MERFPVVARGLRGSTFFRAYPWTVQEMPRCQRASDGAYHLAFAIRPTAAGVTASVSLTVSYGATDTFVSVLPPTTPGDTDMTATFVPESTTIGDNIAPLGMADTVPAPGYAATATQDWQSLNSP